MSFFDALKCEKLWKIWNIWKSEFYGECRL